MLHLTITVIYTGKDGVVFNMNSQERVKAAHRRSINHRREILSSKQCGYFYCGHIFKPAEIDIWTDKNANSVGQTALCPKCSIDSVIGDKSGFPVNEEFLRAMNNYWF